MRSLEAYGDRAARLKQLPVELPGALVEAEGEGHYIGTGGRLVGRVERIIIDECRPDAQRSEGGHAGTLARKRVEAARKHLRKPDLDAQERTTAERALRIADEHLDQARANVLALVPDDTQEAVELQKHPRVLTTSPEDPRALTDFGHKDAELLLASLVAEAGLTEPEAAVVALWQEGFTRKEIAIKRGVGEETIKSQLRTAQDKTKRAAGL